MLVLKKARHKLDDSCVFRAFDQWHRGRNPVSVPGTDEGRRRELLGEQRHQYRSSEANQKGNESHDLSAMVRTWGQGEQHKILIIRDTVSYRQGRATAG